MSSFASSPFTPPARPADGRWITPALLLSLGLHLAAGVRLFDDFKPAPPATAPTPPLRVTLTPPAAPRTQALRPLPAETPTVVPDVIHPSLVPEPVVPPAAASALAPPAPAAHSLPTPSPRPRAVPPAKTAPKTAAPPRARPAPTPQPLLSVAPSPTADASPIPHSASPGEPAPATGPYIPPDLAAAYRHNPRPPYPRAAQRRRLEGVCLLWVELNARGEPTAVRIQQSSGHDLLDQAAREAVAGWRFNPAQRGGQAVAAQVEVPIRFRLEDGP